jgi:hypothetical protein
MKKIEIKLTPEQIKEGIEASEKAFQELSKNPEYIGILPKSYKNWKRKK